MSAVYFLLDLVILIGGGVGTWAFIWAMRDKDDDYDDDDYWGGGLA
jgi:cbb3-type cytochrome oxidase maturation protein